MKHPAAPRDYTGAACFGFGGGSAPKPPEVLPPAPPPPTLQDPAVLEARRRAIAAAARNRGRNATIRTGPQGLIDEQASTAKKTALGN